MPTVERNGIALNVVERGRGEQTVVFSHGFLLDHRQFEPQIAALEDRYRIIAYDHRDLGASDRASSRYDIYDLVDDGAAVIEQTGAAPCHWVGLSTGGFVGMRLAIRRPELLRSVTLMDTSGGGEPLRDFLRYRAMLVVLRLFGFKPLVKTALEALFGPTTMADPDHAAMIDTWRERVLKLDRSALIRFGKAIWSRDDVLDKLRAVELPTLVITGAEDRAIKPEVTREIADAIDGARFERIPDSGHTSSLEQPDAVNEVLEGFLDGLGEQTEAS